jgi:hypothetical protein
MVRRHDNNYYVDYTLDRIQELPEIERPKQVVTLELRVCKIFFTSNEILNFSTFKFIKKDCFFDFIVSYNLYYIIILILKPLNSC